MPCRKRGSMSFPSRVPVAFAAICFTLLLIKPAAAADNWAEFRGPNGTGISDATGLPVRWSETENVRWKTAIHDKGWSSPVVWGNQIWLTTAPADGKQLFSLLLDAFTLECDFRIFLGVKKISCPQVVIARRDAGIDAGSLNDDTYR